MNTIVSLPRPKRAPATNQSRTEDAKPALPPVCVWCCHPYTTETISLPLVRPIGIISRFCSYPCAAAFNEYDSTFNHDKKASYALLSKAYNAAIGKESAIVKVAPSRLALTMFGGSISIDKFRAEDFHVYKPSIGKPFPTGVITEEYIHVNSDGTNPLIESVPNVLRCRKLVKTSTSEIA